MIERTALTTLYRLAFCVGIASATTFSLTAPGLAQGVPVIDGSNLAKNVEQLQQALQDAENQIEQIQQLKRQIELQMEQITSLEFIGDSLTGINDIATLYNSAEDLRDRAAKITDLSGFANDLAMGDFDALLDNLLDGDVTMGEKHAAEQMRETLASAGLTSDRLSQLSSSENPQDKVIAQTAGTSATAIAAAQLSYEEAESSLERVNGLVDEIANQETLKESVDLNTRMAAETNFMLGQMWRLNAAAGLAQGQTGVNWAAEQAKERSFFDYSGTAD
ncbi:type IV secretion system protein [Salipiger thiooxidans]|uniref:type IV secretion system protein n=1 Tax=Salipiger thiooxidans TaxID=282683 RepID=UPI001CD678F9|nr:type IV secretion system protein [Salipiger thiooxidans]MCA0849934.1 type IV secretion system protein [Salipiger thiooxidans]